MADLAPAKELLMSTMASSLFPSDRRKLITVRKTDSIASSFKALIDNNILSAPVYDVRAHSFIGFVDVFDILATIIKAVGSNGNGKDLEELSSTGPFASMTVGSISDLSQRNPYYPVQSNAPLLAVISLFARTKARRLPIISKDGDLETVISQSHIVAFLIHHFSKFGAFPLRTVAELQLGIRDVVTVNKNQTLLEAFRVIHSEGVSAVGVVDDDGLLVGNISNSDIKVIGYNGKLLDSLQMSIADFIKDRRPVVSVNMESTTTEVAMTLRDERVHRVYVLQDGKAIGVISGLDLISAVATLF